MSTLHKCVAVGFAIVLGAVAMLSWTWFDAKEAQSEMSDEIEMSYEIEVNKNVSTALALPDVSELEGIGIQRYGESDDLQIIPHLQYESISKQLQHLWPAKVNRLLESFAMMRLNYVNGDSAAVHFYHGDHETEVIVQHRGEYYLAQNGAELLGVVHSKSGQSLNEPEQADRDPE